MSIVFLLGAGASFGNPDCISTPPPLGNKLFEELEKLNGITKSIKPSIKKEFYKNFENGMNILYKEQELLVPSFLKEMALYFTIFKPGNKNYYLKLIEVSKKIKQQVIFSTTNYEMLIELSATRLGYGYVYEGQPVPKDKISVLKIHGSCNFLPDLKGSIFRNVKFKNNNVNLESDVKPTSIEETINFCKQEDSLAPALAMYNQDKKILFCPNFVLQQQKMFAKEILRARRIYVIGLRVNPVDRHIWSVLAKSTGKLLYVGLEKETFFDWVEKVGRKNTEFLTNTLEESLSVIENHLLKV